MIGIIEMSNIIADLREKTLVIYSFICSIAATEKKRFHFRYNLLQYAAKSVYARKLTSLNSKTRKKSRHCFVGMHATRFAN